MVVHIPKTKYWFTADEHLGHFNIIKYCNRPFKTVDEMDEKIIKRHNERVGPDDTVIHAGDFTMKKTLAEAEAYIERLNGNHIFLRGSHEYWNENLPYVWEKNIDGIYIVVCHYPFASWPHSHYGSINLHGHCHGKMQKIEKRLDIGVDNWDFKPVSFEQIIKATKE